MLYWWKIYTLIAALIFAEAGLLILSLLYGSKR